MKKSLILSALFAALTAVGCGTPDMTAADAVDASAPLANGPLTCSIQTITGNYLTAVGGGGRLNDVLHTDATRVGAWEKFVLIDSQSGDSVIDYGIRTNNGRYLTAVGGGGRITDVIHSDATQLRAWEKFKLHSLGSGWYAIQTISGHYLTAVGGGGRISDAIHSDATVVNAWEKFKFSCVSGG